MKLPVLLLLLGFACTAEEPKPVATYPEKLTLVLADYVSAMSVDPIVDKLEDIKKAGTTKEVYIKIDSYGGELDAGEKLISEIEAMHDVNIKTTCVADFNAMSMAFYILQACDDRLMTKRTLLLVHEPASGGFGNATQMGVMADYLAKKHLAMLEIAAKRMKMSVEELKKKAGDTAWIMGWEEAKNFHAVDGIIDARDLPPVVKTEKKLDIFQLLGM